MDVEVDSHANNQEAQAEVENFNQSNSGDLQNQDEINQQLHAVKRVQKPKKQVTVELLKSEKGFQMLQSSLRKRLRSEFKGPGNEAHDLRKLIEGYRRWQLQFFPYCGFEEFTTKLERVGATFQTKVELREMREKTIKNITDYISAEEEKENLQNIEDVQMEDLVQGENNKEEACGITDQITYSDEQMIALDEEKDDMLDDLFD